MKQEAKTDPSLESEKAITKAEKKNLFSLLFAVISPLFLYGLLLLILFLSSEGKSFSLSFLWQAGVEILPFLTLDLGILLFLRKDSSLRKKERTPDQINYPFQDKPKGWKKLSLLFLILAVLFFFLALFLNLFLFEEDWWKLFFYFFDFLVGVFYLERWKWKKKSLKIKHDLGR